MTSIDTAAHSDSADDSSLDPALFQPHVINPSVNVIRATADEIVAHHGSRSRSSHRVRDGESRGKLADFAAALSEPQAPAALAESVGIDDSTIAEFTAHLVENHVLIPQEQARYAYLASGLGIDPNDRDRVINVAGRGRVADAVARQLQDLTSQPVETGWEVATAFDDADFVIVGSDRPAPHLGYDADEAARATDTPWHLVYVDGFEIMVGPTFVPGESANYYDFDAMDESARVLRTRYLYEKTGTPDVAATVTLPGFVADLAASWVSIAAAQHLWGRGSFLQDYVMRVDVERMQVVRDKVLRLPRNPVDLGMRSDLRHPFL